MTMEPNNIRIKKRNVLKLLLCILSISLIFVIVSNLQDQFPYILPERATLGIFKTYNFEHCYVNQKLIIKSDDITYKYQRDDNNNEIVINEFHNNKLFATYKVSFDNNESIVCYTTDQFTVYYPWASLPQVVNVPNGEYNINLFNKIIVNNTNDKYILTIKCLDGQRNIILKTEVECIKGEEYQITPPDIEGYSCDERINLIMPDIDCYIEFIYQ